MSKFWIVTGSLSTLVVVAGAGVWAGAAYHDRLASAFGAETSAARPMQMEKGTPTTMQAYPDMPVQATGKSLFHCGMHSWVIQDHPGTCPICHMELTRVVASETQVSTAMEGISIAIDPAVVQNIGVQTATVQKGTLYQSIRVVGYLDVPETGLHDVTLKTSGYIEKLYANETGMHVHQGGKLFDFYSPDLVAAEDELIAARKSADAMSSAGPEAQESAKMLMESARRRLQLLDLTDKQIDDTAKQNQASRTVTFTSPVEGHLEDKSVVQGSAVQAGEKLMRIEDHSTLWLNAQVYENELGLVAIGDSAHASFDAFPGKSFSGRIAFIAPHLDHMNRTVAVRIELPNNELLLKPGMYATVQIEMKPLKNVTFAPREAVIDTGTRQIAFVSEAGGHFSHRTITMGRQGDNGEVQILSGLAAGDTVVTSGQFLMDAESRTQEALAKFRGTDQSDAEAPASATMLDMTQTPAVKIGATDTLLREYLAIASYLQQHGDDGKPADVSQFEAAVDTFLKNAEAEYSQSATSLADAIKTMPGHAVEAQRKDFEHVGAAILPLLEKSPPSKSITEKLYIVHCPMAKADWLQTTPDVLNPFLPDMRNCGSVTKTLVLSPATPPRNQQ